MRESVPQLLWRQPVGQRRLPGYFEAPIVVAEMGHGSEALALRIYAHVMRLDEDEKTHLAALVNGEVLAIGGNRAVEALDEHLEAIAA